MSQKIIVVLGPTSSGKSSLSIKIAKQFDGEIISADSRQVYRELDIGSGKVTEAEMNGIPHHLLSIESPEQIFSVPQFKNLAEKAIIDITNRKKLPIIVGGTGLYIQSVIYDIDLPKVPPNKNLRSELEKLSAEDLLERLKQIDPARAETIEQKNPRRLIRAIEIATAIGKVPKLHEKAPRYDALKIGIDTTDEKLKDRIKTRVKKRLKNGWVEEVKKLIDAGVPKNRFVEFGLGYFYIYSHILENVRIIPLEIASKEWQYAKRQRTWFKRDKSIIWFTPEEIDQIIERIKNFLNQ